MVVLIYLERAFWIKSFHDKHPLAEILSSRLGRIEIVTELVASHPNPRLGSGVAGEFGHCISSIEAYEGWYEFDRPCFCPLDINLRRCLTFVAARSTNSSFFPSCFTISGCFSEGLTRLEEEILIVGGMTTFIQGYQESTRSK